jgi:hypothetical protein
VIVKRPNPELVDEDNPEWTAQEIARARPASEVLPKLFGTKGAKEMLTGGGLGPAEVVKLLGGSAKPPPQETF